MHFLNFYELPFVHLKNHLTAAISSITKDR
uniref:Uncharacterized protein n=1 Tax=Arundo donax TaxID=35708 RepID=A0A0A9BQB8_ARUDO